MFSCQSKDAPLVNAAMLEAAAALEQMIKILSHPLDTEAFRTRKQDLGQPQVPVQTDAFAARQVRIYLRRNNLDHFS